MFKIWTNTKTALQTYIFLDMKDVRDDFEP